MSEMRIKFISEGFKEILEGAGVKSLVESETRRIQANANANNENGGEGFSAKVWLGNYGGGRWIGSVSTTDIESRIAESENKALTRAVV